MVYFIRRGSRKCWKRLRFHNCFFNEIILYRVSIRRGSPVFAYNSNHTNNYMIISELFILVH